jgi:IclR family acetate operon transcriptional repressor
LSAVSSYETSGARIQSVERASRLLLLLAGREHGCTLTEAARSMELAVPTTHHLLATLSAEGLAAKDAGRRYRLGPRIAVLAEGFERQSLPGYLLEPLRALSECTGETAYLARWAERDIRALACVEGGNPVHVAEVEPGPYRHAHARATGKLLLAHARPADRAAYLATHPLDPVTARTITDPVVLDAEFATIRDRGYAEDLEEYRDGVACVSAPLIVDGVAIAAFTVSTPAHGYAARRAALRAAALEAAAHPQRERSAP